MSITDEGEYGKKQIDTLEMIWGEGYLSPGGASEIDLILIDKSLKNTILKIGSPPEEIAKSVKFLLESKSITGQFIAVDGGEHLS